MIEAGKKVIYKGETSWAYDHNGVYSVLGYDRELDAWAVLSKDGENAYAVAEEDLEEVADGK